MSSAKIVQIKLLQGQSEDSQVAAADPVSSSFALRAGSSSVIINSSTTSKKKHHHRSSFTSTTLSSSSSSSLPLATRRKPISSFRSIGSPPSPSASIFFNSSIDNSSPLSDLRQRLISVDKSRATLDTNEDKRKQETKILNSTLTTSTTSSHSAPATLTEPKYSLTSSLTKMTATVDQNKLSDENDTNCSTDNNNNNNNTNKPQSSHSMQVIEVDSAPASLLRAAHDTKRTASLSINGQQRDSPEPIVEVKGTSSSSSSANSSASNTPKSPANSPLSSHQSSDCEDNSKLVNDNNNNNNQQQQQQQQQVTSSNLSSGSSSSSCSSRRLIRRRTVRRSYHHRALETEQEASGAEPTVSKSIFVSASTTTTRPGSSLAATSEPEASKQRSSKVERSHIIRSSCNLPKDDQLRATEENQEKDEEQQQQLQHNSGSSISSSSIPTRQFANNHLAINQKQHHQQHQLSSSTSSSKIATTTSTNLQQQQQQQQHQKKSTTSTSKSSNCSSSVSSCCSSSSSSSRQTVRNLQENCKSEMYNNSNNANNMTSGGDQSSQMQTIDLNRQTNLNEQSQQHQQQQQQQQQSLFERRHRNSSTVGLGVGTTSLLADIERADDDTTTCRRRSVEIEQEEESSVHRREISSFNTSTSSRLHHHRQQQQQHQQQKAAAASIARSSCETSSSSSSLSRSATKTMSSTSKEASFNSQQHQSCADLSSSTHHHRFKTSSSRFLTPDGPGTTNSSSSSSGPTALSDVSSYNRQHDGGGNFSSLDDVEIDTYFAELENLSLYTKQQQQQQQQHLSTLSSSSRSSRLFGGGGGGTQINQLPRALRTVSPLALQMGAASAVRPGALVAPNLCKLPNSSSPPPSSSSLLRFNEYNPSADKEFRRQLEQFNNNTSTRPGISCGGGGGYPVDNDYDCTTRRGSATTVGSTGASNEAKIRELMDKAKRHSGSNSSTLPAGSKLASALDNNIGNNDVSNISNISISNRSNNNNNNNNNDNNLNEYEDVDKLSSVKGKQDGNESSSHGVSQFHDSARCTAVMNKSIERIDQKMSDLCKKLENCNDTQKAIDLLKIMIQMIEKAWSVPVCGDDLGFKLCNSLRQFGGLDIILGFIHEADEQLPITGSMDCDSAKVLTPPPPPLATTTENDNQRDTRQQQQQQQQQHQHQHQQQKLNKQLRLNLSKIHQDQDQQQQHDHEQSSLNNNNKLVDSAAISDNDQNDNNQADMLDGSSKSAPIGSLSCQSVADNDSDILTSDLGLDSTSVESLSFVSATAAGAAASSAQTPPPSDNSVSGEGPVGGESAAQIERLTVDIDETRSAQNEVETSSEKMRTTTNNVGDDDYSEEMQRVRKDELVFLSAHLLSQCLTSENRDYIVKFGLDPVIQLACNFTKMKSGHSKRLLKRSALMRQSSTMKQKQQQQQQQHQNQQQRDVQHIAAANEQVSERINPPEQTITNTLTSDITEITMTQQQQQQQQDNCDNNSSQIQQQQQQQQQQQPQQEQRSDMHSAIGTEILQHLFKHSEETCSRTISLGALEAILYGCRSSHIETLRHCASALANLALYGGSDSQQMMIEQKAHVWLFPLAFNKDDNVQYYACLAIVVLAANQEIEADVLQSSTLDLVEPFVTSHEPRKFAESTTSHIHGQSAGWLKKLMPLLESKREEARNLACFHFAMEAHIKREQGQTSLFKEIGSIELLRKAGSSPIAIASKFACQALRLIGEKEPHKLSQQVPLWTCDDVCEWVSQIGFEKFTLNFRESLVDGDLLLTLDEQALKFDLGIENGIIRRRFLRELSNLKRIADYSSVDKSGLGHMLVNSMSIMNNSLKSTNGNQLVATCPASSSSSANRNARDFLQYIYPILQSGVTKDNIHMLDCEQLLADCKISNTLHRIKLAQSIREIQDRILMGAASSEQNPLGSIDQKTLDVFVSYRRSTGSQLASLLKVHLQLRGFSVFIDVERLEAGKFDNNLLESIKTAKNFILVLSPSALDRCIGDHECKDWVHKEIVAALASNCNIIPIIDNFHWPDPEQLPEDMRSITYFNGIRWIHDYQDACVDKVERFIRGELSNSICGGGGSQSTSGCGGSIISSVGGGGGGGGGTGGGSSCCNQSVGGGGGGGGDRGGNCFQRLTSALNQSVTNVSTPTIIATTPSLCSNNQMSFQQQLASNKNHQPQSSDHKSSYTSTDNNHHPLASACAINPYLQHNLRIGNSNNNVRLQ